MPSNFECYVCKTPLKANDNDGGKKGRCPNCSTIVRVPEEENISKRKPPRIPLQTCEHLKHSFQKNENLNDLSEKEFHKTNNFQLIGVSTQLFFHHF